MACAVTEGIEMTKTFWVGGMLGVLLCAQAGSAETLVPPRALGCFEIERLSPDYTARELVDSVRKCVDEGRHGDAMALFIAYNSYALFDQQRVRDETAHLVLEDLNAWVFSGMWSDDMGVLKRYAEQFRDADSAYHQRICSALWKIGPPNYRPSYMIVAGQMPRRDDEDWRVAEFDPGAAWTKAASEINGCVDLTE